MKKLITATLLSGILFVSCKKDHDTDNSSTNPPAATQAVLLKKFILMDATLTAPNDTLVITTYTYDAENRCTFITSDDREFGETIITNNFYNADDSAIQKRQVTYDGGDYDFEYFTYNAARQIIEDSIASNYSTGNSSLVYKFDLTNPLVKLQLNNGLGPVLQANYRQTRNAQGDITAEKDSVFDFSSSDNEYHFNSESTVTISYDNHPSPFYKLYPKRLTQLEYENAVEDFYQYYSSPGSNNILEEQRAVTPSTTGLPTFHNRFTYEYNANGYPSVMHSTDLEDGEQYTGIFIY